VLTCGARVISNLTPHNCYMGQFIGWSDVLSDRPVVSVIQLTKSELCHDVQMKWRTVQQTGWTLRQINNEQVNCIF
jgi:hypothetical protein